MFKLIAAAALVMVPAMASARDLRQVEAKPGKFVVYTDLATLKDGTIQTWTGRFSQDITGDTVSYSGITVAIDCVGNRWRATQYQLFDAKGAILKTLAATKDWAQSTEGPFKTLVDIACHPATTPSPRLGNADPFASITRYFAKDVAK